MKCDVVSDLDDIDFCSVPTGVSNLLRQIVYFFWSWREEDLSRATLPQLMQALSEAYPPTVSDPQQSQSH